MWRQVNSVNRFLIHFQANTRLWERTGLGHFSPSSHDSLVDSPFLEERTSSIRLHKCKLRNMLSCSW